MQFKIIIMELVINFIIFFASLAVLVKSAQLVTDNSVKIARITGLGEVVIGFILLSIGSNLPEVGIAISSVISENVEITLGNIFGSNVASICLVIGSMSLLGVSIRIYKRTMKELSIILFIVSSIPIILLAGIYFSRILGLVLIFVFLAFCWYSVKKRMTLQNKFKKRAKKREKFKFSIVFFLCLGIILVLVSSKFVVDSAAEISSIIGISGAVIGATIISIGSTLPELSIGITAVRKGYIGLALGGVVGSSLTTVTIVLGLVILISPVMIDLTIFSTLIGFMVFSCILLWIFFGRGKLGRTEGIILFLFYALFLLTTFGIQIFRVL